MLNHLKTATLLYLLMMLLTGVIYPLVVTGLAQMIFPRQANGSLLVDKSKHVIGSELIGQSFTEARYFWSRPSATAPYPYNASASSGSNSGPTNPALIDTLRSRVQTAQDADPDHRRPLPVDLATASASGLDPHISLAAAAYQSARVAHARGLPSDAIEKLIAQTTEGRQWGFLGEPRVNVLLLNLALDKLDSRLTPHNK